MKVLASAIVDLALDFETPTAIVEEVEGLVFDLLGERKNLFYGVKESLVTHEEAASGILSHLHTYKGGYLVQNNYLLLNAEAEITEYLIENI